MQNLTEAEYAEAAAEEAAFKHYRPCRACSHASNEGSMWGLLPTGKGVLKAGTVVITAGSTGTLIGSHCSREWLHPGATVATYTNAGHPASAILILGSSILLPMVAAVPHHWSCYHAAGQKYAQQRCPLSLKSEDEERRQAIPASLCLGLR